MNKNSLVIAGAILIAVLMAGGVFLYIHQSDMDFKTQQLELEKQKEQTKKDDAAVADAAAYNEKISKQLRYTSCITAADAKRDNDLTINSDYETKDANGGTVYHGDASIFDAIEKAAQQEKARCSSMYQ